MYLSVSSLSPGSPHPNVSFSFLLTTWFPPSQYIFHFPAYLLVCSIPACPVNGVRGEIGPVDVIQTVITVQGHSALQSLKWDNNVSSLRCVKGNPADVRPSGEQQERPKIWKIKYMGYKLDQKDFMEFKKKK